MRHLTLPVLVSFFAIAGCGKSTGENTTPSKAELLNVSYDPTRELYQEINGAFARKYLAEKNVEVEIKQSHGGSSSQSRAVIDGLDADVVTLALWSDVDQIRKKGRIKAGWEERLPNHSLPYYSTIVFVVRKGNPKNIKDWPDLVQPGVEIITPNPITGGGAKLNLLAAWGSVVLRGGTEEEAKQYLQKLYSQVPVLDSARAAAATTFAQKKIGDVHLAWENEAYREVAELPEELEIVTPPISIFAEPNVAVVGEVVEKHGTRELAQAYLEFLYSDEGQQIVARHRYRPSNEKVAAEHRADFADIKLFRIGEIAKDWDDAFERFFGEGGVFNQIYEERK